MFEWNFFTADRLKHQEKYKDQPDADKCKFCGEVDSQVHRHWQCKHFGSCRQLAQEQIDMILQLPVCVGAHGWMPEPPSLCKFQTLCIHAQDDHEIFCSPINYSLFWIVSQMEDAWHLPARWHA